MGEEASGGEGRQGQPFRPTKPRPRIWIFVHRVNAAGLVAAGLVAGMAVLAFLAFLELSDQQGPATPAGGEAVDGPQEVYNFTGTWFAEAPRDGPSSQSFELGTGGTATVTVHVAATSGCVSLDLVAPDGGRLGSGKQCGTFDHEWTVSAAGTWGVEYSYEAFVGNVAVSAVET